MGSLRRSDSTRLEALSDGVFAFAATLLVVSLQVPGTFDELMADLSGLGAFAVSFGALLLIWAVHNAYFRRYGLEDGMTQVLNGCLLFVVLFYVFPLKFVAAGVTSMVFGIDVERTGRMITSYDELSQLFMLYSFGFFLIFAIVSLMYAYAARRAPELALDTAQLAEAHFLKRHYAIFALVAIVSIAFAYWRIGLAIGGAGLDLRAARSFLLGPRGLERAPYRHCHATVTFGCCNTPREQANPGGGG